VLTELLALSGIAQSTFQRAGCDADHLRAMPMRPSFSVSIETL